MIKFVNNFKNTIMKQFIPMLLGLLMLVFTLDSNAQLADGTVVPNFTTTDVNGNPHDLYEYLDAGYTVIVDISATWCGPCWSYHEGGAFEEIWEAHGPAGEPGVSENTTDDVVILWFEGDPGTAESELENSTLGNWLEPNGNAVNFPIMNDNNVAEFFDLSFYPTIFTICPNKRVKLTGQLNATQHYAELGNCEQPVEGTNAALTSMSSNISAVGCEASASGSLSVVVQNFGTSTINSFTVEVIGNGQTIASEDFNGSLDVFETTEIDFGNITVETENIEITITSSDDDAEDNTLTESFQFNTGETEETVTIKFLTDNFASETYLEIKNELGEVVWSEGNESVEGNYNTGNEDAPTDPTTPLANNTSYEWDVNLTSLDCYTFFIGDYFGDGLDASQWGGTNGSWSIENNNGVVISQQTVANFGGSDQSSFLNKVAADPSSIEESFAQSIAVYPNPVQSNTTISFNLKESSKVRLDVLNVLGETLISSNYPMNAGNNTIDLNVDKLTSGVYFAHLTINGETNTVKLTVSK